VNISKGEFMFAPAAQVPRLMRQFEGLQAGLPAIPWNRRKRAENPRVGGSIPSLATKKSFIFLIFTSPAEHRTN
jgi:hypothetical protein